MCTSSYQLYLRNIINLLRNGSVNSLKLKETAKQITFEIELPRDTILDKSYVAEYSSNEYPSNLRLLPNSPIVILLYGYSYIEGIHCRNIVGFTGSRILDKQIEGIVRSFFHLICKYKSKILVVTGGAKGIDRLCMNLCFENNIPQIVVAPILTRELEVFCNENSNVTVITIYPQGTKIEKRMYLERNSVIASLSNALVLCKSSLYSGSMHTANCALNIGRKVFVNNYYDLNNCEYAGNSYLLENGCLDMYKLHNFLDSLSKSV